MRAPLLILAALGLAACNPSMPDSGAGVGFQDYNSYLKQRSANPGPAPSALPPQAPLSGFSPEGAAAAIDKADGIGGANDAPYALAPTAPSMPASADTSSGTRARGDAPAGIKQESGEMDYVTGGVSDEQDFEAVKARETIESDKARIASNRAKYQIDQPGALPERKGDTGPNIVEYALSTSHPIGTQLYRRSSIRLTSPEAACAKYGSPDLAQEAFLASGGPDRDRRGLDPDGDGYACAWDPAPFRTALQ